MCTRQPTDPNRPYDRRSYRIQRDDFRLCKQSFEKLMGARQSPDTLFGQWTMLRRIPRYLQRIATAELKGILTAEGIAVTARTVQCDLEKLSVIFPLGSAQASSRCPSSGSADRNPAARSSTTPPALISVFPVWRSPARPACERNFPGPASIRHGTALAPQIHAPAFITCRRERGLWLAI